MRTCPGVGPEAGWQGPRTERKSAWPEARTGDESADTGKDQDVSFHHKSNRQPLQGFEQESNKSVI